MGPVIQTLGYMSFQACEDLWKVLHMSAGSHAFILSNLQSHHSVFSFVVVLFSFQKQTDFFCQSCLTSALGECNLIPNHLSFPGSA